MEAFSVTSTTIPSSLTRREAAAVKPSGHVNLSKYSHFINYPFTTTPCKNRIRSNIIRAQVSGDKPCFFSNHFLLILVCVNVKHVCIFIQGSTKSSTAEGIPEKKDSKDDNLVFVAGATGKVGSRTVRYISYSTLLNSTF